MPIIKSAKKRVKVSAKKQLRNALTKSTYRNLIKEFTALVDAGKTAEATKLFPQVQKAIDMAVKKNLMHANTAGRKKSNLSKKINSKQA